MHLRQKAQQMQQTLCFKAIGTHLVLLAAKCRGVRSGVGEGSERWVKVKDSSGDQAWVGLVVPVRRRGSLWQTVGAANGCQTGPL